MNAPYLLLTQRIGHPARVEYHTDTVEELLFEGGRVAAKKFLKAKRLEIGWENVPAFCEKRARRGRPPTFVQIP